MAEVTSPIMTDDTGQSIASAITALGSTLGSDKANIDGSNIANPSAFRSAIGAQAATTATSGVCTSVNASLGFGPKTVLMLNNRIACGTIEFYTTASISVNTDLFDLPIETVQKLIIQVRADNGNVYLLNADANSKRVNSYTTSLPANNYKGSFTYVTV